jgi:four helix bundle protein
LKLEIASVENNIILNKSRKFGASIVDVERVVPLRYRSIAKQLIRAGTSIGACVAEAQSAETMADFVHKLKIADKEANETYYWLGILEKQIPGFSRQLEPDLIEIKKLLSSIITTCRRKMKK